MSEYNGWTNYETWNCNLWLDNDEGTYHAIREYAEECVRTNDDKNDAVNALAEHLEETVDMNAPDLGASMFADLLRAALGEIDYHEIAEHHISDLWDEIKSEDNNETEK